MKTINIIKILGIIGLLFLLPSISNAQIQRVWNIAEYTSTMLPPPATGTKVAYRTLNNSLFYWNGSAWVRIAGPGIVDTSYSLSFSSPNLSLLGSGSSVSLTNLYTAGYGLIKTAEAWRADTTSPNGLATRLFAKTLPTSILTTQVAVSNGSNLVGSANYTYTETAPLRTLKIGATFIQDDNNGRYIEAANGIFIRGTTNTNNLIRVDAVNQLAILTGINGVNVRNTATLNTAVFTAISGPPSYSIMEFGKQRNDGVKYGVIRTIDETFGGAGSPINLQIYPGKNTSTAEQANTFLAFDGTNPRGNILIGTGTDVPTSILTARSTTKSSSPFPLHTTAESNAITGVENNWDWETGLGLRGYDGTRKFYVPESAAPNGTSTYVPFWNVNRQLDQSANFTYNSTNNNLLVGGTNFFTSAGHLQIIPATSGVGLLFGTSGTGNPGNYASLSGAGNIIMLNPTVSGSRLGGTFNNNTIIGGIGGGYTYNRTGATAIGRNAGLSASDFGDYGTSLDGGVFYSSPASNVGGAWADGNFFSKYFIGVISSSHSSYMNSTTNMVYLFNKNIRTYQLSGETSDQGATDFTLIGASMRRENPNTNSTGTFRIISGHNLGNGIGRSLAFAVSLPAAAAAVGDPFRAVTDIMFISGSTGNLGIRTSAATQGMDVNEDLIVRDTFFNTNPATHSAQNGLAVWKSTPQGYALGKATFGSGLSYAAGVLSATGSADGNGIYSSSATLANHTTRARIPDNGNLYFGQRFNSNADSAYWYIANYGGGERELAFGITDTASTGFTGGTFYSDGAGEMNWELETAGASGSTSVKAQDGTFSVVTNGGNMTLSAGVANEVAITGLVKAKQESYYTVTSNSSPQTLSSDHSDNLINQGGTQATFTLNMPASPEDGQVCYITFNNAISTLTIDGNGETIVGSAVVTGVPGSQRKFKFYSGIGWIKQY